MDLPSPLKAKSVPHGLSAHLVKTVVSGRRAKSVEIVQIAVNVLLARTAAGIVRVEMMTEARVVGIAIVMTVRRVLNARQIVHLAMTAASVLPVMIVQHVMIAPIVAETAHRVMTEGAAMSADPIEIVQRAMTVPPVMIARLAMTEVAIVTKRAIEIVTRSIAEVIVATVMTGAIVVIAAVIGTNADLAIANLAV